MYTANLTANLTLDQIKSDIHGLADLPGKAVGSWSGYADDLKAHNIAITPFKWDSSADEYAMVAALESGYIRALVMPDSTLEILDATNCDTMLVGKQFSQFDQCTAFPPGSSTAMISAYDAAVISLLHDGGVEALQNRFILVPQAPCKTSGVNQVSKSSVSWSEVSGLWILLGGAFALGLLAVAVYWLWKWAGPRMARVGWFRRFCCCHQQQKRVKKSYTTLMALGRQQHSAPSASGAGQLTPQVGALGHLKSEQERWDDRYIGAGDGYLDGSTDVAAVERMKVLRAAETESASAAAGAQAPPRQASMLRSDTALQQRALASGGIGGGGEVNGSAAPAGSEFEAAVLRQLAELRAELAAVRGGGGSGGGGNEVARGPTAPRSRHLGIRGLEEDSVRGDAAV